MTDNPTSNRPDSLRPAFDQSIAGCLVETIGEHGLSSDELAPYLERLNPLVADLRGDAETGRLALLNICQETDDIEAAQAALEKLSRGADHIIFLGTGGSSLGGQTLAQLAGWNIPGSVLPGASARPRTRFLDNLDGDTFDKAIKSLNLAKSRFVVTSKSGGTAETLAQAIAALSAVRAVGLTEKIPELFLGITEPESPGKKNGLRTLFAEHAIPMLEHHTGIGGRFSCLTNVGLLPAMARGLDVYQLRAGAQSVVDRAFHAREASDLPAAVGAAVAVALSKEKGIRTLVMMPYVDRLGRLAHWFVQLWAESLGKGGEGTTPIGALGPLDQHSQLQLFMDGPREHLITILRIANTGEGSKIDPELADIAGADYLAGKTINDVVNAQAHAVPQALAKAGRPVRVIDIPDLDAYAMGALLMHFMLETIIAGRLLGLDPFDQPAVELAKVLTRERLQN